MSAEKDEDSDVPLCVRVLRRIYSVAFNGRVTDCSLRYHGLEYSFRFEQRGHFTSETRARLIDAFETETRKVIEISFCGDSVFLVKVNSVIDEPQEGRSMRWLLRQVGMRGPQSFDACECEVTSRYIWLRYNLPQEAVNNHSSKKGYFLKALEIADRSSFKLKCGVTQTRLFFKLYI